MTTTRGGKVLENRIEYYGRHAHRHSTLPGQRRKKSSVAKNTRSQQSSLPPPPQYVPPPRPAPKIIVPRLLRRSTSDEKPYCSAYGCSRYDLFPTYHFCSPCKLFDEDLLFPHLTNVIKRTSFVYKCTADHTSWACPTQTSDKYLTTKVNKGNVNCKPPSKCRRKYVINEESEADDASTLTDPEDKLVEDLIEKDEVIRRLEELNQELRSENNVVVEEMNKLTQLMEQQEKDNHLLSSENSQLCDELLQLIRSEKTTKQESESKIKVMRDKQCEQLRQMEEMRKTINRTTRTLNYQHNSKEVLLEQMRQNINIASTATEVVTLFINNLDRLSREKNRNPKKLATFVANALWDPELLGGILVESLLEKAKQEIKLHIFSPQNILRAMDMYGGTLSMQSIEVLRKLETSNGSKTTIMPSSGAIKNVCKVVDKYTNLVVPFTEGQEYDGSEFAEFDPAAVVSLMLKAFSLEETAKIRSVKINQAVDGAQLTTRTHHCTLGLKMADKAAIDPMTGNLLFASNDATTIQSRNNCFPIRIVFQRESKKMLETFKTTIDKVRKLTEIDHAKEELQCFPIQSAMDSDMSATWKLCGKGGATKIHKYPCHMCAVGDSELEFANAVKCDRWCKQYHNDDTTFKCYHKEFLSDENVIVLRAKLDTYKEEIQCLIPELEKICADSKINCVDDPRSAPSYLQLKDQLSIHFDYNRATVTKLMKEDFSNNVTHDLRLRKLPATGTRTERIVLLRNRLTQEYIYKSIHKSIVHAEKGKDTAMLMMIECVPCILHLENRTGLKILTIILQAGLNNVLKHRLYKSTKGIMNRMQKYIYELETIFNTRIFGTEERRSNYHLPFNYQERKFEDITMDNNRTRAVMQNCDEIINTCFFREHRKLFWVSIVQKYNLMIHSLRQKDDFTDAQICEFQCNADDFYQLYIDVNGRPGITNYFHMLGSGHIAAFLFYYRNLYSHSQQGWEAFNSYLKVFYFRRTSRGGGRGDFNRVRQIARWLARRLVWMSGVDYRSMLESQRIEFMSDSSEMNSEEEDDEYLLEYMDTVDNNILLL